MSGRIYRQALLLCSLVVTALLMVLVVVPSARAYSFHPTSASRRSLSLAGGRSAVSFTHNPSKNIQRSNTLSSTTTTTTTTTNSGNQLSMHMGHGHSHHHHHQDVATTTTTTTPSSPPPKTIAGHVLRFSKRPVIRLAFSFLVVFVPALVRRRHRGVAAMVSTTRADLAAFFIISATLGFADGTRREFQRVWERVMNWKDGILKHAPRDAKPTSFKDRLFSKSREQAADRVTLLAVITNLILSVGKLVVGITCHSSALIADAGHSLSDLFSDFITLWAVQIARLPPDDDHPYGHGKFEAIGALFLALTLLGTGLGVGGSSYGKLMDIIKLQKAGTVAVAAAAAVQVPTFPALIMAFLSIVSKEWLYRITRSVGEDLNSQVVLANAWHHRSDAYSSILALVSISLAMLVPSLLAADSAAGLLVGGMICMTGAEILGEAVQQLTDSSADEGLEKSVKNIALQESEDVKEVTGIRTRQMGSKAFVDVYITTSESLSNSAVRAVEDRVKIAILKNEQNVVDVDVHAKRPTMIGLNPNNAMDEDDNQHNHDHSHPRPNELVEEEADSRSHDAMETRFVEDSALIHPEDEPQGASPSTEAANSPYADEVFGQYSSMGENTGMQAISSFQEVEDDARQLLNGHASVKTIEGCTVHYDEALQEVQVDVTIKLENPDWTTVTIATSLARELKIILEEGSANIAKANIFLDLNSPAESAVAESTIGKASNTTAAAAATAEVPVP